MADTDLISFHRMLLADPVRMRAYRSAIHETVRAGDVVLDVGSGTGVLGLFACQAGAGRVICVERTEIISVAQQLAVANGYLERMEFLRVDALEAQIGPVDVITSELLGKSVLGQNMSGIVGHCRDRWLKPGGRILPIAAHLWVAPIEEVEFDRRTRLPEAVEHGLDLSPFAQLSSNRPVSLRVPAQALLAPGQLVYTYRAATSPLQGAFDTTVCFNPQRRARVAGFCAWFTSQLSPSIELSNTPPGTDSWDTYVHLLPEPVEAQPGDCLELRFRGREDSPVIWIWDTDLQRGGTPIAAFRQSSIY
jgi:hypothetical protein